jgi:hypothetical protein
MDPITILTAALVSGAAIMGKEFASAAAKEAFNRLRDAVVRRAGERSGVPAAIQGIEEKPDSQGRKLTLQEELTAARLGDDRELLKLAEGLLELLKTTAKAPTVYSGAVSGSGALAQGEEAKAVGAGGMMVGGYVNVSGKGNAVGVGNTSNSTETVTRGVDAAQLVALLETLRHGIASAGLDAKTRKVIESDLEAACAEAQDDKPSAAIVLSKLKGMADLLTSAGAAGAAAAGLLPGIQQAIDWAGNLWK